MRTHALSHWAGRLAAAAVLFAAVPALAAAPPLNTSLKEVPKGSSRDQYAKGQTAYTSGHYREAAEAWAGLLDSLTEEPRTQSVRAALILDIMAASTEAYRQSGHEEDLEAGLAHYFRYFGAYKAAYGHPRIPRAVVDARYALRDLLRDAKAQPEPGNTVSADGDEDPAAGDVDGAGADEEIPQSATGEDPAPAGEGNNSGRGIILTAGGSQGDRVVTPFIAAGAAVLAVGVGASAMIAVGSIEGKRAREEQHTEGLTDEQRDNIDKRGRTMNGVFIAGLVATPVLIGGGAALLGIGIKRSRDRKLQAIAPKVDKRFVGLTVRGRF